MKEFVIPKHVEEVPEKRIVPQTIVLDLKDNMLSIVFHNDEAVQIVDQDLSDFVALAMAKAQASHPILKSAIIQDVAENKAQE